MKNTMKITNEQAQGYGLQAKKEELKANIAMMTGTGIMNSGINQGPSAQKQYPAHYDSKAANQGSGLNTNIVNQYGTAAA